MGQLHCGIYEIGLFLLQVVMDFRHPDGRHIAVLLPRRSAIVMTGESRYVWTHAITPRKADVIPIKISQTDENFPLHSEAADKGVENQVDDCENEKNGSEKTTVISGANSVKLTLMKRQTRTSFTFRKVLHGPCKCSEYYRCYF